MPRKKAQQSRQTAAAEAVEVEGVAIVKRDFGEVIDVNRMVQTATEVIKQQRRNRHRLLWLMTGKTCRIMIMAGEAAIKKGVNAGAIVKEVAPIMGGGGGGRPNFAQGGGTKCDKLAETVSAAEEAVKKQLEALRLLFLFVLGFNFYICHALLFAMAMDPFKKVFVSRFGCFAGCIRLCCLRCLECDCDREYPGFRVRHSHRQGSSYGWGCSRLFCFVEER